MIPTWQTWQQTQQADPPTLDSGQTSTTDHRHQAPPAPATIDSSTEDPMPCHDPGPGSRTAPRPATAPQSQDSGRPAPTHDDSAHAAQEANRTRHAPTLDSWTGSGSPTPTGSTSNAIPARTPPML